MRVLLTSLMAGKVRVREAFTEEDRKRHKTITNTINPVLENT